MPNQALEYVPFRGSFGNGRGASDEIGRVCAGSRCVAVTCVEEEIEVKKRVLRACEKVKASERYRIQCT